MAGGREGLVALVVVASLDMIGRLGGYEEGRERRRAREAREVNAFRRE